MSMKIIELPKGQPLAWYLDEEVRLAKDVQEELFFCWTVSPTVIYGRHQQREVQRKSGGGCVYADRGNLMLSLISQDTHSEAVFCRFMRLVSNALRALGLNAVTTAHNDILVEGRKVSGNACYALPNATIVHGTLMYDVDIDALEQAITPGEAKLSRTSARCCRIYRILTPWRKR